MVEGALVLRQAQDERDVKLPDYEERESRSGRSLQLWIARRRWTGVEAEWVTD